MSATMPIVRLSHFDEYQTAAVPKNRKRRKGERRAEQMKDEAFEDFQLECNIEILGLKTELDMASTREAKHLGMINTLSDAMLLLSKRLSDIDQAKTIRFLATIQVQLEEIANTRSPLNPKGRKQ